MKKNMKKQFTAIGMATFLAFATAMPVSANELTALPSSETEPSASASTEKEEVVYITLNTDGTLKNTYVVNSFAGGNVIDYGDYTSVKMLNVNTPIEKEGDLITISSSAEKVYYQGDLADAEIPWNVSLRYYLDGKEYAPEEIAGKSGKLKIWLQITKNSDCTGTFFEDYALQTSFSLDSKLCNNIDAPDATIASVGSNKQISYTILPGKGIDTSITADVKDFEMSEVAINGIHLNLNVEIDDAELKVKVNELMDAVEKLDDGASDLYDGSGELVNGSSDLKTGASSLHSGITALDEGIITLQNGLNTVQNGLNSLNAQSATLVNGSSEFKKSLLTLQTAVDSFSVEGEKLTELVTASGQIKQAVSDLNTGASVLQENLGYAQYKVLMKQNGLDIDELTTGNTKAVETIEEYEKLLEAIGQIPDYEDIVAQYKPSLIEAADQITGLLTANNAAINGMESYLNGVSAEIPALTKGLSELNTQYEAFDTAISTFVANLSNMTGELSDLAEGINQLVLGYEKLDSGIEAYTGGVAELVTGYAQIMSGVSSLAQGSKELTSSSNQLYDGTAKLYDGVVSLCDGAKDMSEGTGEFRTETSGMDEKIDEEIDSILDAIGGSMENPVSFVSSKNTNVDSVQFVIRTDSVKKQETVKTEAVVEEEPSLLQKFLNLFR